MDYKRQHEIRKTAARICPAAGGGVQHIVCAETHQMLSLRIMGMKKRGKLFQLILFQYLCVSGRLSF